MKTTEEKINEQIKHLEDYRAEIIDNAKMATLITSERIIGWGDKMVKIENQLSILYQIKLTK